MKLRMCNIKLTNPIQFGQGCFSKSLPYNTIEVDIKCAYNSKRKIIIIIH